MATTLPRCIISFLYVLLLALHTLTFAFDSSAIEATADRAIEQLYHRAMSMPNTSMPGRIEWFSAQFKGAPYVLGALGEGPHAYFDQFPRYRLDGFDCDTYVNTVAALALGNSLHEFQHCMNAMRYKDARVGYITRNHFTSLDWNKNNAQRGVLKDITLSLVDAHHKPVAHMAHAIINKSGWYSFKTKSTIRLQQSSVKEQEARLAVLKHKGALLKTQESTLPYIPTAALITQKGTLNPVLSAQIPQGAIVEIIRPNWDLRASIGTALNVSHLGFAIWHDHKLYFRQASSHGTVRDVLMIDYLKEMLKSPTIKGINIQVVVPQKPLGQKCLLPD